MTKKLKNVTSIKGTSIKVLAYEKPIKRTPYSMNSLFSEFFMKFEGVILGLFGTIFGRRFGRKIGVKIVEKTPPKYPTRLFEIPLK